MEKWYEVGVSYVDDGNTETIATFDTLEKAKKYALNPYDLKELITYGDVVNFIFIDKWYAEEGGSAFKDYSFDAIVYKENK